MHINNIYYTENQRVAQAAFLYYSIKNRTRPSPIPLPSVLSGFYSGKPPCLNFHPAALSAVNDATASPPFSALLMKIYPAEFRQIESGQYTVPQVPPMAYTPMKIAGRKQLHKPPAIN